MEFFGKLTKSEAAQKSALSLAYLGDAVHSLYVRERLVAGHDYKPDQLHKTSSTVVNAGAQAHLAEKIFPNLSEEEQSVFLRGRNASPAHKNKNQIGGDYRKATGLEALLGYLYLIGDEARLKQILETEI
ncbi:MAG: ribonuclease III [Corallococcus sp.]|nr:ribonuclease III [Corallococcus sp.]MCM1359370.1 ribonuclease III [Corallococcus sp.]MCM1394813.1 ribonuclease III [Corallococcus sp.]